MGTGTAQVMRIVTKFTSEDALVEAFRRYCTTTSCFIPGLQAKVVGGELGFSIRLADGTLMVRGTCTIITSWADDMNPFGRPGVQLGVESITPETRPVYDRLCRANEADEPVERLDEHVDITAPIATGSTLLSLVAGRHTDKMEPLPEHERPVIMTLLGVAPITGSRRGSAPRMAMPALSPNGAPPESLPVVASGAERPTIAIAPRRRRSVWSRVFGRLSALLRSVRWAYRRRRAVRTTLRRLPTRT